MRTFEGRKQRSDDSPGFPRQDLLALGLIAAIVVVGFILEGMRIAMTGFPEGSSYAFKGYCDWSVVFQRGFALQAFTAYVWYVHAVLTGAFIAYLPFSRLLHIIVSPLVLMGNAVSRKEEGHRRHRHIGTKGQTEERTKTYNAFSALFLCAFVTLSLA